MDGMSLSEELSEVEAGSEILQVEACDQTSNFFLGSDSGFLKKPDPFKTRSGLKKIRSDILLYKRGGRVGFFGTGRGRYPRVAG